MRLRTRQELLGDKHERESDQQGNCDRRRREIRVPGGTIRVACLDDGFYPSGKFALRTEIVEWIKRTRSGMVNPNPTPRSNPVAESVNISAKGPTTS